MADTYVSKINGHLVKDKEARDRLDLLEKSAGDSGGGSIKKITLPSLFGTFSSEELAGILASPESYSFLVYDENITYDPTEGFMLHFEAELPDKLVYSNALLRKETEFFYVSIEITKASGRYKTSDRMYYWGGQYTLSPDSTYKSLDKAIYAFSMGLQVVLVELNTQTQSMAISSDYTNKKLTFHNAQEQLLITYERTENNADTDTIGYGSRRKLHSDTVKLVSTEKEMNDILEREGGEGVGSNYIYVGTTTDNYTKGTIYQLTEANK